MTDTLADVPAYPMQRQETCPFDPPPDLARLREDQPIARVRIWDGSTPWLITRYDDQRAVLADPRFSADPRNSGYPAVSAAVLARRENSRAFIAMDNPEHDVHRRMLTRDFTIKRVETMRPRIQRIVDDLIDDMLAATTPVDLVQAFALPVPSMVICELLGVPYTDRAFFHQHSRAIISRATSVEDSIASSDALKGYLSDLIGVKETDPGDDVLSRLVQTQLRPGTLSRSQIADMGLLLLVAGHETTANMIGLGTLALLENPAQLAELRETDDPKLVAGAVEELLRYLNIVHSGRRRVATEDVEVAGQLVKAGEGVVLANDAGNRDTTAFTGNPDELDIHRDSRHHVAFGYGVHQCLGQPLARVELQVVYSTLYRRIPTLRLAVPLSEISFKHDMIVYGVHSLPVTW
jgi:cytochrome P450